MVPRKVKVKSDVFIFIMYHLLYPLRSYLIVSGDGETNVMTADWLTILSSRPLMLGVAIAPKRYTHALIEKCGEFVVAVPTLEMLSAVWTAGTESGPDKIKKLDITFVDSKKIRVKSVKEAIANLECRVVEKKRYGDHTFFVGEVIAYTYDKRFFRNGRVDLKCNPLAHLFMNEFVTFENRVHKV